MVASGVVCSSFTVAFARLKPAEKQVAPAVPCGAVACFTIWLAVFLSFCFVLCVSGKPENSASNEVPGELLSVGK